MLAQIDFRYIRTRPIKLISRLVSYALFEGRPLTTRGRWINPFLFALFALGKCLPQFKKVEQPVFILGTGRSGTTILGIVLSMHRDVGFLNEPKALWHAIYADEDLIGSYSHGVAHYRLEAIDADIKTKRNAHRLFGAYLATIFSRRLVDKYPELIFRIPFVKEIFPDAKFIFLVRNGWDTCSSIEGWSNRFGEDIGEETHNWWGKDRRKWNLLVDKLVVEHSDLIPNIEAMRTWEKQTDMAAVEWIITMREGLKLLEEFPDSVLRVDFEELCAKPREQLKIISEFFDFERDDCFLSYGEETLNSVEEKPAFKLDPAIQQIFLDTMQLLGYKTN